MPTPVDYLELRLLGYDTLFVVSLFQKRPPLCQVGAQHPWLCFLLPLCTYDSEDVEKAPLDVNGDMHEANVGTGKGE